MDKKEANKIVADRKEAVRIVSEHFICNSNISPSDLVFEAWLSLRKYLLDSFRVEDLLNRCNCPIEIQVIEDCEKPKKPKKSKWRNTEEKLPKKGCHVLGLFCDRTLDIVYLDDLTNRWVDTQGRTFGIIAIPFWRKLPRLPKEARRDR